MLAPSQINPLQIPRVIELLHLAALVLSRLFGYPVDPKCPAAQEVAADLLLILGETWRVEIERIAA